MPEVSETTVILGGRICEVESEIVGGVSVLPAELAIEVTAACPGIALGTSDISGAQETASLRVTYWFRLRCCFAASITSRRCRSSPSRSWNFPE